MPSDRKLAKNVAFRVANSTSPARELERKQVRLFNETLSLAVQLRNKLELVKQEQNSNHPKTAITAKLLQVLEVWIDT